LINFATSSQNPADDVPQLRKVNLWLHHKLATILILLLTILTYWSGGLDFIDRDLMDLRFRLVQRAPTEDLLISLPLRDDIQIPVAEQLIVELYSK